MRRRVLLALSLLAATSFVAAGCSDETADEADGELDVVEGEVEESLGGPVVKSTDGEVWAVTNAWADRNTPAAKKAGVAWPAHSGLTWEEKYQKWIGSFERVDARPDDYGKTIRFKTPYGKTMDGPVLECADVAIWLRLTFASWYELPFYMTASSSRRPIYYGHFGVVDANGDPVGRTRFRSSYRDYTTRWRPGEAWPSDANLRREHVGDDDDAAGLKIDGRTLASGDGAGAYFDELFLNKRVGYLLLLLDRSFGSVHLGSAANMFHIKPEATSAGDVLVKRYGRTGIGHTLPVMTARILPSGKMRISEASGSMPRRQPMWEEEKQALYSFGAEAAGGAGMSTDGFPYAKLGGGIRRWRTPVLQDGRWYNVVPSASRSVYIPDRDFLAIEARPARFKDLLAEETPQAARDGALSAIEAARARMRGTPASCAGRTAREDAFTSLYDIMSRSFGKSKAEVDAQYRTLEDYVFAELVYEQSKTCCWNNSTPQMGEIILDYAKKEKAVADAQRVCRQPTVFRATGSGSYDIWKTHAAMLGRASQWTDWVASPQERCNPSSLQDPLTSRGTAPMCR